MSALDKWIEMTKPAAGSIERREVFEARRAARAELAALRARCADLELIARGMHRCDVSTFIQHPRLVEAMTRPLSEIACCAHLRVSYAPIHNDDGTVSPRWLCNLCDSRFAPASNPESACEPVEGDGAGAADPWTGDQRRAAFSVCESVQRWGRCEVPLSEVCETLAHVAPLFAPEPAKPEPAALHPPTAQSIDLATIVPSNGHTDPDALIAKPREGFVVDRDRFNGIANRAGLAVARAIDECIAEIERQRAEWAGGAP